MHHHVIVACGSCRLWERTERAHRSLQNHGTVLPNVHTPHQLFLSEERRSELLSLLETVSIRLSSTAKTSHCEAEVCWFGTLRAIRSARRSPQHARARVYSVELNNDRTGRETRMAKYGKSASKNVKSAMHRRKKGTLKSGSGRKVKSRKQAIAIGLSEARKKGAKVPKRKSSSSKKR